MRGGIDPYDLPLYRICNLAFVLILEGLMFADEERQKFIDAMAWPDDAASSSEKREDRAVRDAAATLGIDMKGIEEQWAFQRRLAADLERQRAAKASQVPAPVEAEASAGWRAEQERRPGEGA